MALILVSAILFLVVIFFAHQANFFAKKNIALIDLLNVKSTEIKSFQSWCEFHTSNLAYFATYYQVHFIKEGIILIEDYSLDANKGSESYANTYLLKYKEKKTEFDNNLFRNIGTINSIEVTDDGKSSISFENCTINYFHFFNSDFNTTTKVILNIKLGHNEIITLLKYYLLL